MWKVVFTKQAQKDSKKLKEAGLDGKAKELIDVVRKDPFAAQPRYEKLVGNLSGAYSRRISRQHRFVYEVIAGGAGDGFEGFVKVVRMWTHYGE